MRSLWLGFLALFCASSSCLDPTEVDVTLKTDLRCPNGPPGDNVPTLAHTDVQVLDPDGTWRTVGGTDACGEKGRVGNIVFVPDKHTEVHMRAVGKVPGHDDLRAMRILRFVQHQKLDLDVMLEAACVGVPCKETETCIMGRCGPPPIIGGTDAGGPDDGGGGVVDSPSADAVILDAGLDVVPIKDSGLDVGSDTSILDAGVCPPPWTSFNTVDYRWRFDEGMGAGSTADDSQAYKAPMITGVSLVTDVPCGSALLYNTTAKFDLLTTKWNPSPDLIVAFYLQITQGSFGTVLQRNVGVSGGWEFILGNNNMLSFNLYFGMTPVTLKMAQLTTGAPHAVVGEYVSGTIFFVVDKVQVDKVGAGSMLGANNADIYVGPMTQCSKIIIDELTLGH